MSSGRKLLRQNTRERVISTDFNRQQAFGYGYANEFLREQILTPVDDEFFAGVTFTSAGSLSFAVSVTAPAAPDAGVVLNGLMVLVPISARRCGIERPYAGKSRRWSWSGADRVQRGYQHARHACLDRESRRKRAR